jgi:hypothetical protein
VHPIGATRALLTTATLEDTLTEAHGTAPDPPLTKATGRKIANLLLALAEQVDDTTPEDVTREWLVEHAGQGRSGVVDLETADGRTDVTSGAVTHFTATDGCAYVHLPSLGSFVRREYGIVVTIDELRARLGRLGFTKREIVGSRSLNGGQRGRKRTYWRSPDGFLNDDGGTT